MASYQRNQSRFTLADYLNALRWENPERSTNRVRKRVDDLLAQQGIDCCWSGNALRRQRYAVDHAFPFARWPNNDLWNLLPTRTEINSKKSDKLPTQQTLVQARVLIVDWWRTGWHEHRDEFFTQANLALPNLAPDNKNYDDVFEALTLQRERIKQTQQLQDWHLTR